MQVAGGFYLVVGDSKRPVCFSDRRHGCNVCTSSRQLQLASRSTSIKGALHVSLLDNVGHCSNSKSTDIQSRKPLYIGAAAFAITMWTSFTLYALNSEKASSSGQYMRSARLILPALSLRTAENSTLRKKTGDQPVVRTLSYQLKTSERVKEVLGDNVHPIPVIFGDPWVSGSASHSPLRGSRIPNSDRDLTPSEKDPVATGQRRYIISSTGETR
jgi:hypothetical protein